MNSQEDAASSLVGRQHGKAVCEFCSHCSPDHILVHRIQFRLLQADYDGSSISNKFIDSVLPCAVVQSSDVPIEYLTVSLCHKTEANIPSFGVTGF